MKITVLQDHTTFFERMILSAYDHTIGLPLSVQALNTIRLKTVVGKYQGKLYTLDHLTDLAGSPTTPEPEQRKIAKVMAAAVEADIEAWYCVRNDAGARWLQNNFVGPVLSWDGALWWGKLKGLEIEAEVVFDEHFRKRSGSDKGTAAAATGHRDTRVPRSTNLFRPGVEAIE